MADYIAQPDTAVDPDAPVTSDLMYALRDNPIAMFEGAAGAPRLTNSALLQPIAGTAYTMAPTVTLNTSSSGSTSNGSPRSLPIRTGVVTFTMTKSGGTGTVSILINDSVVESETANGTYNYNRTLSVGDTVSYTTTGASVASTFMIRSGNDAPISRS